MKNYLKLVPLFISLILFCGFNPKAPVTKWVITNGCSLKVAGTTNINKFTCTIFNYSTPDTLSVYRNNSALPVRVKGAVALDVQNFDCQNSMITKDLRKTLKAKEFPKLMIRFITLSKYPDFDGKTESVKGFVSISLAGVSKQYEVNYKVISQGEKSLILIGTQDVNFSDFELTPPKKAAGMIKTNNLLQVEFNLKLKVLD